MPSFERRKRNLNFLKVAAKKVKMESVLPLKQKVEEEEVKVKVEEDKEEVKVKVEEEKEEAMHLSAVTSTGGPS